MATSIEQLNTVQHYLADIAHVPSLSHEKESLLLQRICTARQCGDPHLEAQARCGLIEGYLHHVISIAKQHQYLFHSLSLPDLIQEGNIGLLQAVKDYDFTQTSGCFFADATACIRNAIIRALPKDCLIRVSRSDYWRMAEQGTLHDLYRRQPLSLDATHDEEYGLYDILPTSTLVAPASIAEGKRGQVDLLLSVLTQREQTVVRLLYRLDEDDGRTLTQRDCRTPRSGSWHDTTSGRPLLSQTAYRFEDSAAHAAIDQPTGNKGG